jgi:cell wall-associated NlpC family hydrolase
VGTVSPALAAYPDVPTSHWAYPAVQYVSITNNWMLPYGTDFRPNQAVTRLQVARALVMTFAPTETADPAITFTDLTPASGASYRIANISVKKGWLSPISGAFSPSSPVNKTTMDRALVLALGLNSVAVGLNGISTTDGYHFAHSHYFAYFILANELHLNFNYPTTLERQEVLASTSVSRAFFAYALWQAKTLSSWQLGSLQAYAMITLPQMNAAEKKAVEFAFKYAGYPYVYAGEWYKPTGAGYCCGTQLQGGFDCSGFAWWMLKAADGSWSNASIRGYAGWPLPERTASQMTRNAPTRLAFSKLQPMDLLGFNTDDLGTSWSGVDHAGLYLGSGWMVHSSGSRGGVSIDFIGDGSWWFSRFVWGRRLMPTYVPPLPPPPPPPSPSPSPTASA